MNHVLAFHSRIHVYLLVYHYLDSRCHGALILSTACGSSPGNELSFKSGCKCNRLNGPVQRCFGKTKPSFSLNMKCSANQPINYANWMKNEVISKPRNTQDFNRI